MRDLSAAHSYGRAFFHRAMARGEILSCRQGLRAAMQLMAGEPAAARAFQHPLLRVEEKVQVLRRGLGEYATPLVTGFLRLLIAKKRLGLLPLIVQRFETQADESEGVQAVSVRSARDLSDKEQRKLQNKLEQAAGRKIRLDTQVDPLLLGGVVVRLGDWVLDGSLRGQLRRLSEQWRSVT